MNDLHDICSQVWTTPDVEDKRNLLRRAVATFKYKGKNTEILQRIATATAADCDFFASNLILNKTDKVVGLLKR